VTLREEAGISTRPGSTPVWLSEHGDRLDEFQSVMLSETDPRDYPRAVGIDHGVPVYPGDLFDAALGDPDECRSLQAELVRALLDGPGIVIVTGAFADRGAVDRASDVFRQMIADQRASGSVVGDHYAVPGANDRVWNALEKLAVRDPEAFAAYYANDVIAIVSSAWLGPGYQITSQVNVVNPGGAAQVPHTDYHLGFLTAEQAERYPAHVHRLSPALTLQGAVAHVDMPVESGPTMYLPHSHKYRSSYLAWWRPEYRGYFDDHFVQLALTKGDAVFFNPALFHAAGHNRSTDCRRMANLLQISSAFGRAMEYVDRTRMCSALYPTLVALHTAGAQERALRNVVAASAEAYAFPTNLDRDPPVEGLAPPSQADVVWQALHEGWDGDRFRSELLAHAARRASDEHPHDV
jgi:ectoine hydroxylase-related dioxygenase (phytanoyl-CoA dioxygenase family)